MTTSVSTRPSTALNPTRQQLDELDALLQRMLALPVSAAEEPPPPEEEEPVEAPPQYVHEPSAPPVSYMVVETASPRPLPPASGFEPRPGTLAPRLVPVTPAEDEQRAELPPPEMPAETPSAETEAWVPLRSTWQPSPQTWPPLADSWNQAHGAPPAPPLPPPFEATFGSPEASASGPSQPEADASGSPEPAAEEPAVEPSPRLSLSAEDAPESAPVLLLPLVWFNQGFDACLAPLGPVGRWVSGPSGRRLLGAVGLACLAAAVAVAVSAGMGWSW